MRVFEEYRITCARLSATKSHAQTRASLEEQPLTTGTADDESPYTKHIRIHRTKEEHVAVLTPNDWNGP